jgi:hypothetical protein
MSEIQENTEAKLAAYIDGEMDPADRAEIERLIDQNPNYRRVLEQLRQTRDLLRALPRESAPPELTEAFNGQLERSVLLDGLGSESRKPGLAINRWPQWMMAAAIVLLTAGLGTIVFLMLPKGKPTVSVASTGSQPRATSPMKGNATEPAVQLPGSKSEEDEPENPDDNDAARRDGLHAQEMVGGPTANAPANGAAGKDASSLSASEVADLAQNVYQNPDVQTLLNRDQVKQDSLRNGAPGALVLVVRSNDPQQARKEVSSYFTTNNISWIAAPEEVPATVNRAMFRRTTGESADDTLAQAQSQWQQLLASGRGALRTNAQGGQNSPSQSSAPNAQNPPTTNAASQSNQNVVPSANVRTRQQSARSAGDTDLRSGGGISGAATPSAPAQPNDRPAASLSPSREPIAGAAAGALPMPVATDLAFAPVDNVLVARQVSRQQVRELNDALASHGGEVRQTELLVGGEVKEAAQAQSAASEPASTEPVGIADAQVHQTREMLKRSPSTEFRGAPGQSKPTTRPSEAEPADSFARPRKRQGEEEDRSSTTRPIALGGLSVFATTRPASPAVPAPPAADQPIDLVIVLRKQPPSANATNAPTTAPTTQPTTQP